MLIDSEVFNQHLEANFDLARETIQDDPHEQLTPWLEVALIGGEDDGEIHVCHLADFGSNRYRVMAALGQEYGKSRQVVAAVFLVTEAWRSVVDRAAYEAHPDNRVTPSEDPDRQEVVMVVGATVDLQCASIIAMVERDPDGTARLGPPERMIETSSDLIKTFLANYAAAYLAAGDG